MCVCVCEREREGETWQLLFIIYEPTSNRVHDNLLLTRKLRTRRSRDHIGSFVRQGNRAISRVHARFPLRFARLSVGLVFGSRGRERFPRSELTATEIKVGAFYERDPVPFIFSVRLFEYLHMYMG